jgi:hypothetical protein|tara:strand:+ start:1047 stop:1748 length:702 start_codon:yes stop_codon:yes gene_type:complete
MVELIKKEERALANYSFSDIAAGDSVVVFYGGNFLEEDNISGNILSNQTFYSSQIAQKIYSVRIDNNTKLMEKNFDLTFGSTNIVNGNVNVNVPISMGDAQPGAETQTVHMSGQLILYHVDTAGTETSLGEKLTDTLAKELGDNEQFGHIIFARFPVTKQKFKPNEKMRLSVNLWGRNVTDRQKVWGIGNDPQNRNDIGLSTDVPPSTEQAWKAFDDATDTNLLVQVPFEVDV